VTSVIIMMVEGRVRKWKKKGMKERFNKEKG
jgi:hypothetical protein